MIVSFEILRYFRLVKVKTLEDLESIKKIFLEELSDEEFLVVFYLGLDSRYGVNINEKGELVYCERPRKYISSWLAWYLGLSKERMRQIIAEIECKVYNAFYHTDFSKEDFIRFLAEQRRREDEELKKRIIDRVAEMISNGERISKRGIAQEFGISIKKLKGMVGSLTGNKKASKIKVR